MTKRAILILLILLTLLYAGSFVFSYDRIRRNRDPLLLTDVARLLPVKVHRVDTHDDVEGLQLALAEAREQGLKVSISGSKHSQGGHTRYPGGIVLDMSSFTKILAIDAENKTIRVQGGATWADVQDAINPHGLAVSVMQSSNVFTVGGTLSSNAHGRDLQRSSVVETVRSFRLLTADGEILEVSRTEHPELFALAIGGYGLFGIILDVDLDLVENEVYEQRSVIVDYRDFPEHVERNVLGDPTAKMLLARPSVASDSFLEEIVVVTWHATDERPEGVFELTKERNVLRDRFFFGLSRKYDWAKDLRWELQKRIELGVGATRMMSRTNAMRPPAAPVAFLDYHSSSDTDILQEYFIPVRNFVPFMDDFRSILREHDVNAISFTVRHVRANDEVLLSYAPHEDAFAIILMSNVGLAEEAQEKARVATRAIVDAALEHDGTYYLTYQLYPTVEQMRAAYPHADQFFAEKLRFDPGKVFMNIFYETYANRQ